jgi:hypothetical protein
LGKGFSDRIKNWFPMIFAGTALFLMNNLIIFGQNAENGNYTNLKPEPLNWYAGDIHVHRSCNGSPAIPAEELNKRMEKNDLAVISILADMGNSEAPDRMEDLQKVNGKDSPLSKPGRIIHYTAEWHWDADELQQPHQALGGHLVLLGLDEAHKIWDESVWKILDWSKKHNAICGFAHMQYLNDQIPKKLNCCIPIDYPVEAALKTIDFISEDCNGSDYTLNAYYRLLNCGFRIGLAAGTDYPCNGGAAFGTLLTYVNIPGGKLIYRKWIEGIRYGRTVISRNGHNEFLELRVNKSGMPGDVIRLSKKGSVDIDIKWSGVIELTGRTELVCNGKVVASKEGIVSPGTPVCFHTSQAFTHSGWLCARRMDDKGHQTHTAPVYIILNNEPIRTNANDALYFVYWIDNILENISPGGLWSKFYTHDLEIVQNRYKKARDIYSRIAEEAQKINN